MTSRRTGRGCCLHTARRSSASHILGSQAGFSFAPMLGGHAPHTGAACDVDARRAVSDLDNDSPSSLTIG